MSKYEDDVHNCTTERLAEMLETYNEWRRGKAPYDKAGAKCPFEPETIGQMIDEAAKRLRCVPRIPFNHEAFE